MDKVRKDLARQGANLRGGLWALRDNARARSSSSKNLAASAAKVASWVDRSRRVPFRDLARTIKRHFDTIPAHMGTRLTKGVMEAINGLLQPDKRIARGFRNFHYFRLAACLKAGGINLQAPRLLPT